MGALAIPVASILFLLSGIHLYWAAGGGAGRGAAIPDIGGRPAIHPGPLACMTVALLLGAAALLLLGRAGALSLPVPRWVVTSGAWTVGAVFALRAVGDFRLFGLFRRVTGTAFA